MPTGRFTVVAKIFVTSPTLAGIVDKSDANSVDGWLFGVDAGGDLRFAVYS